MFIFINVFNRLRLYCVSGMQPPVRLECSVFKLVLLIKIIPLTFFVSRGLGAVAPAALEAPLIAFGLERPPGPAGGLVARVIETSQEGQGGREGDSPWQRHAGCGMLEAVRIRERPGMRAEGEFPGRLEASHREET